MLIQAGLDLLNIVALKDKNVCLSEGHKLDFLGLPLLLHLIQLSLETSLPLSSLADFCELVEKVVGDIKLL